MSHTVGTRLAGGGVLQRCAIGNDPVTCDLSTVRKESARSDLPGIIVAGEPGVQRLSRSSSSLNLFKLSPFAPRCSFSSIAVSITLLRRNRIKSPPMLCFHSLQHVIMSLLGDRNGEMVPFVLHPPLLPAHLPYPVLEPRILDVFGPTDYALPCI